MPLHVLDTDVLTLLRCGNDEVRRRAVAVPPDELAVTIVTVEESLTGWYSKIRRTRSDDALVRAYAWLQEAVEHLRNVRILKFDLQAATIARSLRSQNRRNGINDIRIAAIVLSHNGTLITRNIRDFSRIGGLSVVDWTVP